MIISLKRKQYTIKALDFETHNDDVSVKNRETGVWLGCYIDENSTEDDENSYIYSVKDLLNRINKDTENNSNLLVYIYNLSFEWSFILPVLLELGFQFRASIGSKDELVYTSITNKTVTSVWSATIKIGKKNGVCEFRDLAKLYAGGLANVAKSLGLPEQKVEGFQYNLDRRFDHVVTKGEKHYCFIDTKIVIDVVKIMYDKGDIDFFKSLSASSYSMLKLVSLGYKRSFKPYKSFRKDYPILDEKEIDFLGHAKAGGICYATPRYMFVNINKPILHIDAHQMHPSSAYLNYFPYGKGEYGVGYPKFEVTKMYILHVKVSYSGVKFHSIIKLIGNDITEDSELWLWDFELSLMYEVYNNLEVQYIDYYCYKSKVLPWRKFYRINYEMRKIAKSKKDMLESNRRKLLNNGSYGKMGENPHNIIFQNYIKSDGTIDSLEVPKDEPKAVAKYSYLPLNTAIPAYSRVCLIRTALKFGVENVIYFDTDSIFCIYNEQTQKVWESELINKKDELGGWGLEEISKSGQFTAPKRYKLLTNDNEVILKMAGINTEETFPYEEINILDSTWEIKRAYKAKGGTVIDLQKKEMKVDKKYLSIYKNNIEKKV